MLDLRIRYAPDEKFRHVAESLGYVAGILFDQGRGRNTVASLLVSTLPAILVDQIVFTFKSNGAPDGYMTWAFVSDELLAKLQADQVGLLDSSEWCEGLNLWIVDLVAPRGRSKYLIAKARESIPASIRTVNGLRRHPDGRARRVVRGQVRLACDPLMADPG